MRRRNPYRLRCFAALIGTALTCGSVGSAHARGEYQVKAAFLFNFAKFVQWPEARTAGPLIIGIVGDDPFGAAIAVLRGKRVRGRDVQVKLLSDTDDPSECHIVFVPKSANAQPTLQKVRDASVLTVGDDDAFIESGGMFQFRVDEGRVRLDVSLQNTVAAGLKVSARLLKLARVVNGAPQ